MIILFPIQSIPQFHPHPKPFDLQLRSCFIRPDDYYNIQKAAEWR